MKENKIHCKHGQNSFLLCNWSFKEISFNFRTYVSGRYVLLVGIAAYALNTSNFMHWHIIYTQQRKTRSYGTNIEQSPLMFVSVILENGK